jgi:hypothetical protein
VFAWELTEIAHECFLPVEIATSKAEQEEHKKAPVQCELYVDILKSRGREQKVNDDYDGGFTGCSSANRKSRSCMCCAATEEPLPEPHAFCLPMPAAQDHSAHEEQRFHL